MHTLCNLKIMSSLQLGTYIRFHEDTLGSQIHDLDVEFCMFTCCIMSNFYSGKKNVVVLRWRVQQMWSSKIINVK